MDDFIILSADSSTPYSIFEQLSSLDKQAVGNEGWSAESFRSEAEKDNGFVLYAENSDGIIALLSAYSAIGEADITSVAVAPAYRRRGLAQKLIMELESRLPDDTESIFLEVRESNTPAITLYEKCGFERLSIRRNFYSDPSENAIVMQKHI